MVVRPPKVPVGRPTAPATIPVVVARLAHALPAQTAKAAVRRAPAPFHKRTPAAGRPRQAGERHDVVDAAFYRLPVLVVTRMQRPAGMIRAYVPVQLAAPGRVQLRPVPEVLAVLAPSPASNLVDDLTQLPIAATLAAADLAPQAVQEEVAPAVLRLLPA